MVAVGQHVHEIGRTIETALIMRLVFHELDALSRKFPHHRAHFFHVFNDHEAATVGVCDEGDCRIIQLK